MTFNYDLDLESAGLSYKFCTSSAHRLTKINISPKFYENPSSSKGDMEQTQN